MPDGTEITVEDLARAEAEARRAHAERVKGDGLPSSLGAALASAIEAAQAAATASPEDIRAMELRLAHEGRKERIGGSGIKSVLCAEDRRRILADTLEPTQALRETQDWLALAMRPKDPGPNTLVLCGHPGTGKTVAAGWAISMMGGRYVTTEEYLRAYSRWTRDLTRDESNAREIERYEGRGLIVLDELGAERDAATMRDALHRLVDRRQTRRGQLTLIITNLTRNTLRARMRDGTYDPRTYDRMQRNAHVVGVRGGSMRQGKAWEGDWG